MDHSEVRELLQDAAIEPGGLERLMAGDTPSAALVASHLAGCAECGDELERLRRTVGAIRPAVRASAPPELRQRTLDFVAAVGRPRGPADAVSPVAVAPGALAAAPVPNRRLPLRALAALAAVLIVAVTSTGLLVAAGQNGLVRAQAAEVEALGDVARWTLRIDAQPDARRVALASTGGATTGGRLLFSPGTTELVIVAEALPLPASGREYRCWVEVDGARQPIGKMFFGGELAYWVGKVDKVKELPSSARFGVSLVDLAAPASSGQPVLEGDG